MRLALVIVGLFFLVLTVRSHARDLNYQEKVVLAPMKKSIEVRQYMMEKINPRDLSFRDFLSYQVLKNSCVLVNEKIEYIHNASEDYKNQAKELATLYTLCSEGILGLSHIYIDQKS
ncbi:MAG: hypothetical protein GY909_07525 [Oligoflexia bacterium]|nr:hypothetical protein [Oligoflexia bacterium]